MHPITIPTIVRARKVVMASRSSTARQDVLAVAPEGPGRVVHPNELAPLDPHHDVAGWRALARRIPSRQQAVGVELVDVLEDGDDSGPGGLAARRLARRLE